jgi:nitrate/nitrite transporter NarK
VGHGLCATCYLGCIAAPSALTFFLSISFAAFFNDLTMGAAWATCQDIGKRYAAIVAGCMNTIGNLGGAASAYLIGFVLEKAVHRYQDANGIILSTLAPAEKAAALREANLPGWQFNFVTFAVVYFVAMALWFAIDATRPVAEDA